MYAKTVVISALLAITEARFGQEQTPVSFITALSNFGSSGEAATLAGSVPGVLLAAADPCAKLQLADKIVTTLGTDSAVISGAAQVVAAEQNFNPFVVSIPNICGDATLPATAELRGIVPLIDPAVTGSDTENANSASSLTTPFDATGLSVAEVMIAQGFSNFSVNGQDQSSGSTGSSASASDAATATTVASSAAAAATTIKCNKSSATASAAATTAASATTASADAAATSAAASAATGAGAVSDPVTGTFDGFQASSLGLDFGTCTPTVKFEESLDGRKAGEFTFQAQDPVVNKGQEEALNPNIIFNRICDQLVNVCGAADDAHTACTTAQASLGGGAKNASTADAWNTALGFAGTNINPDNAPQTGLVGHT
ncbi:putative Circumsporozoite protein [Seiridium cardinale]